MSGSRELDERALACRHWRWMPGMLDSDGVRFCTLVNGRPHGELRSGHASMVRGLPDLADPATLGCLLSLVREAWGRPSMYAASEDSADGSGVAWWYLADGGDYVVADACGHVVGGTEAEALVAALEAAP